ncbi:hypothetical protein V8E51_016681 [Hyaloscypha variabilis]
MAVLLGLGICLTAILAFLFIRKTRRAPRQLSVILANYNRYPRREQTPLEKLPPEMLLSIIDYLPAPSVACLTLSSIPLMFKLGTKRFTTTMAAKRPVKIKYAFLLRDQRDLPVLTTDGREHEAFLQLLDKDSRDSIYCFYCNSLHSPMATKPRSKWKVTDEEQLPCFYLIRQRSVLTDYLHDLTFSQVQYALKLYNEGRYLEARRQPESMRSSTAEIGHLNRYGVDEGDRGRLILPNCPWEVNCKIAHYFDYALISINRQDCKRDIFDCHSVVRQMSSEDDCFCGLKSDCWKCRTEFRILKGEIRDGKFWIKIVTWKDLGRGETPFEPVWDNHIHGFRHFRSNGPSWSISEAFEEAE